MCISWGSRETEPRLDRYNKRAVVRFILKNWLTWLRGLASMTFLGQASSLETQAGILCDRIKAEFLSQLISGFLLFDCRKSIYIVEDSSFT